jgi:hypothetical protein
MFILCRSTLGLPGGASYVPCHLTLMARLCPFTYGAKGDSFWEVVGSYGGTKDLRSQNTGA